MYTPPMRLYKVTFNDFGEDYVIAEDWNKAGEKIQKFYLDSTIKEIKLIAEVNNNINSNLTATRLLI